MFLPSCFWNKYNIDNTNLILYISLYTLATSHHNSWSQHGRLLQKTLKERDMYLSGSLLCCVGYRELTFPHYQDAISILSGPLRKKI
jgi:hypothetical protein